MKKTLCYAMMLALLVTSIPLSIAEDLSIQNVVFQDESLPYGSVEAPDDEELEFEGNGAADDMSSLSIDGDVELPGTIQTVEGIPDLTVEISGGLLEGEMPNETEDGTNEDASMEPPLVENEPDEGDLRFDYYYYKIEDGKAIITDVEKQKIYDDDGRFVEENKLQYVNVNIPEAIDGCPVTRIGGGVFDGAKNLQSVTLPDSLREIGWGAFANCESLSDVALPAGLELLDCFAFNNCHSLTKINIPINVHSHEYVTEHAYSGPFVNCENLREVVFAEGMATVPKGLFFRCPGIRDITVPNTVNKIEIGAFEECAGLASVTIPESVKEIDNYAFAWSESLKSAKLPSGLTYLGIGAFKGCKALSKINIPAKVKMHGYCAENYMYPGPFAECSGLRTVTFNKGISVIPRGLFYQCDGLREITIPDSVTEIQYEAFYNCVNLRKIKLGKKLKFIGDNAFIWCESLKSATLPASLTYLGLAAFKGCKVLAKINIPAKMNTNDRCGDNINFPGPFSECSGLRTVTFAKGIKSIPKGLFYQCNGIEKITLPDSIVTLEADAFCCCSALTEIHIGAYITDIGDYAFYGCDNFKHVYYVADKASWEKINIGSDNEQLKNAKFHYGKKVTGIKLNKKGTITMQKKETLQLEVTLTPKGAKSRLVWKSSDSTIAKVNQDGMVTAVKNGQATITVTTTNGKSVSVKIVVAPVCRALLIGEAIYEDGNSNLRGVYTDIDNMEKMLKKVKGPGGANWQITKKANLKAKDILRWIKTAFKDADKDDISLFYFGGHGAWKENLKKTALCATDITFPVDNLVDPLNAVPGKMIIIVDACHSGGMIQANGRRESDIAPELAAIDGGIVDAFSRVDRIQSNYGEFRSNKFYVLTACQYDETSICNIAFGGFFTWWLIEGMNVSSKTKAMKADNDRNKQVTLSELYDFIASQGPKTVSWDKNHIQHVQVYPEESSFVMFQK